MAKVVGQEIATIDVALVTLSPHGSNDELAIKTNTQVGVSPNVETQDPITLVKGSRLIAQKPQQTTILGHTLTFTDCVFIPQLAVILQGGMLEYDEDNPGKVRKYTPPVSGSGEKGEIFDVSVYSAVYDQAGLLDGYEKTTYPNGQGTPIGLPSQDNTFRTPEYTINSAPKKGQPPYIIEYVDELPEVVSLEISEESVIVPVGGAHAISYLVTPPGQVIDWQSGDPTIATVDNDGIVTGISPGNTRVSGTIANVSCSIGIEVTEED